MGRSKPVSNQSIDVISSLSTRSSLQYLNYNSKHYITCFYCHAECQYTEFHYTECGYTVCHYAECYYAEYHYESVTVPYEGIMYVHSQMAHSKPI